MRKRRRLGVNVGRCITAGARREAVDSTVLWSTVLSDLIDIRCDENGVDQPTGALRDPD
jgi:hypothetical protein